MLPVSQPIFAFNTIFKKCVETCKTRVRTKATLKSKYS